MKIYFFTYDNEGRAVTEAFKSRTQAQKRLRDMRVRHTEVKKAMQEYVINRINGAKRPTDRAPEPPKEIREAEFAISSEGLLEAFIYASNKRS